MASRDAAALRGLIAKQAIEQALAQHGRGVDRGHTPTLRAVYDDDADTSYGAPALPMVRRLAESHRALPGTLHRGSNAWIRLTSATTAVSESSVIARLATPGADGPVHRLVGGRYLDRHVARDGAWRLAHRTYVLDWNTNHTPNDAWPEAEGAAFAPRGGKGAGDPGMVLLASWGAALNVHEERAMSASPTDRELDLALSRQALHELLAAYCRGADRADAALLASCFHDDASVVTGAFNGPAREFARDVAAHLRAHVTRVFHTVSNEWFQIRGDHAVGECYVLAIATRRENGADVDAWTGGRYLDRFERRAGTWKIRERVFVQDWNATQPSTARFDDAFYAGLKLRGCYGPEDPVYAFWGA